MPPLPNANICPQIYEILFILAKSELIVTRPRILVCDFIFYNLYTNVFALRFRPIQSSRKRKNHECVVFTFDCYVQPV